MKELFIKYLKGHVGDIYVWGAQGETNITEKWIRRRETGEKNAERAIALWEKRKAEGRSPIAAFDCSGLIVKFLLDNKLIKKRYVLQGAVLRLRKAERQEPAHAGGPAFPP